jgi:polysaccharide pyruvyl transferase WcaK-like protein
MDCMSTPSRRRIVLVGDVGASRTLHVGDEAMAETAIAQLRRRLDAELTLLSRAPADTRDRYGVESIERIGFAGLDHEQVMARHARVLALLAGDDDALAADDPARGVIAAIEGADGVLITGGGNITTLYAEHLAERAAVGAIAARHGVPLVIGGQSLGPHFDEGDASLVAELLDRAALAAAREPGSFALARGLAPRAAVVETGDDAALLDPADEPDAAVARRHGLEPGAFVAVSFSPASGTIGYRALLDDLRSLVASIAAATGATVVLLRHEGAIDPALTLADDAIAQALEGIVGVRSVRVRDARTTAALTRTAALCVTSRYHGAVFALAGSVPCVALWPEHYSQQKMRGLLDHHGLGTWSAPLTAIGTGHAARLVAAAWAERSAIAAHLERARPAAVDHATAWWDAVAAVLDGREPTLPGPFVAPPELAVAAPLRDELSRLAALTLLVEQSGASPEPDAVDWHARVRELEASTSWRVTAPLRALTARIRRR